MHSTSKWRRRRATRAHVKRHAAHIQAQLGRFKQWAAELVAGEFDAAAVDSKLDCLIAGGRPGEGEGATTGAPAGVVVFSFTSCPFCKRAKELLASKGAS